MSSDEEKTSLEKVQDSWTSVDKNGANVPLAMFATAIAGGVGLFKFYKPNSNPTIRFARARIVAQGTLIGVLSCMAIAGLSGSDGKKHRGREDFDLNKRRR
mmetsp:Transcript_4332/g.7903  ORF Transcript_4332/g.7903 Transcript_4332/m.7903 type:complete len:101 (-) Transcript_4332:181-483(-)|eukprot:CAMPEP_0197525874 /NCGR_PEP_ID=MMETSP1318-20131121/15054_1 /TAXON_ID=552666 /ORGANISM="Partenskyella glossopodia, Strain RCC365" /LENGTH=100 /DNA_ID=CAMNT_0043079697 /DNA_START=9 /DNA_END=311 /DNA_ORIENTATION=-